MFHTYLRGDTTTTQQSYIQGVRKVLENLDNYFEWIDQTYWLGILYLVEGKNVSPNVYRGNFNLFNINPYFVTHDCKGLFNRKIIMLRKGL